MDRPTYSPEQKAYIAELLEEAYRENRGVMLHTFGNGEKNAVDMRGCMKHCSVIEIFYSAIYILHELWKFEPQLRNMLEGPINDLKEQIEYALKIDSQKITEERLNTTKGAFDA